MATSLVAGACGGSTTTPNATAVPTTEGAPAVPLSSLVWSRVPDDDAVFGGQGEQRMASVTVGGPGLVAVGSSQKPGGPDAVVWTSTDGIIWSRVPDDDAVFGGNGAQEMRSVTAGGPGLVAVGLGWTDVVNAAVWTSTDGITWSRVPHDDAVFGGGEMTSVTVGGPGLVAVGSDGADAAVWASPDGITWSRVLPDDAIFGGDGFQRMLSVTAGGPGLVAVGRGELSSLHRAAVVWTSPDGISWSRVPHDDAVFGAAGGQGIERGRSMTSVTVGGPGLVAVGRDLSGGQDLDLNAVVWTSPDGITWSLLPDDEGVFSGEGGQEMNSVTAWGPGLVAVGRDQTTVYTDAAVWTSDDGITWSHVSNNKAVFEATLLQDMLSVTVGGPGLVAVGNGGSDFDLDAAVWVAGTEN